MPTNNRSFAILLTLKSANPDCVLNPWCLRTSETPLLELLNIIWILKLCIMEKFHHTS